jgi:hypothetical protein
MRIKTQNMIVFTVEFTRTPLFPSGRIRTQILAAYTSLETLADHPRSQ